MASLLYEGRNDGVRELRWRAVEHKQVYQAVFAALIGQKLDLNQARLLAAEQVSGYFGVNSPTLRAIVTSAQRSVQPLQIEAEHAQIAAASANSREQTAPSAELSANVRADNSRTPGNKADVRAYIRVHPGSEALSADKLKTELVNVGIFAGRTLIAEVLREFRTSANAGAESANEEAQP